MAWTQHLDLPVAVGEQEEVSLLRPERPRSLARPARPYVKGLVAVVGCDGSGKTRLVADLVKILRRDQLAERQYMGLISGETGDKIKRTPLFGVVLERYLAAKVRRAQDMEKKLPGPATAIVMYLFSLWRASKLRRLTERAGRGTLMIAERYPQAEIPGFHYDGPGLATGRTSGWLARSLATREQSLYDEMSQQRPMLVIRLDIDAETAYARKSDHPISELRDKIAAMPRIEYNGAKIIEIDSRKPYAQVLAAALNAIEAAETSSAEAVRHECETYTV
jgi:thymidylate kinase